MNIGKGIDRGMILAIGDLFRRLPTAHDRKHNF
jgi:hypothetical protein